MNINEKQQKIKLLIEDLFLVFLILGVALISFGLGRLSALSGNKEPLRIEKTQMGNVLSATGEEYPGGNKEEVVLSGGGLLVGSKNGSKYHFPWCSGAQRIKKENEVWFESREEAEEAGYQPAGNCKGL